MTAFSRVQPVSGGGVVDLNLLAVDVLEWTRARWQTEAQLRGITISARLQPGDVPPIRGDEGALREVLLNVVLNAIDALPAGGKIVVRTWHDETRVYCSICDDGVGMSQETAERALEPFFTTKGPQSRGLGLSVAYGTVRRHSGVLAIDSDVGRGTLVTIALPRAGARAAADRTRGAPPSERRSILVIDDDPAVRTVLRALLQRDGYEVIDALDGADALTRLERGDKVDLVLTDLIMPGMNGWAVVRGVRRVRPDLPVVLITGWDELAPDTDEAADAIVHKPVIDVELREALARVLGVEQRATARHSGASAGA
jgi:CheY-like chemotaxis protein/anti-sigma regulatory factor (Ser/Thr protein kinase)